MTTRQLIRDPMGQLIIPGRVVKQAVWPFMTDTTTPAGLTTAGTSVTFAPQSGGTSGSIALNSMNSTWASVSTWALNWSNLQAVWLQLEGVAFAGVFDDIRIGYGSSSSVGVTYSWFNGKVYINGSSTVVSTQNVTYANYQWQATQHVSFGLLVRTDTKHAYLTIGDQVLCDLDISGDTGSIGTMALGSCTPNFSIHSTDTTTGGTAYIEQIKLTTYSY